MKLIYRLITIVVFLGILTAIIAYARGYRFDFEKPAFNSTGILAVSSSPKAAKVFINNELKGVTDLNLTVSPGIYTIDVKKDGFTSYSRKISLKGELVMPVDALLFPVNPSLSPLTNLGLVKAVPLDQTDKILIFSDVGDSTKDGIYLFETNKKTLSFFPPLKPIILRTDLPDGLNFKNSNVYFSPDFKQAIVEFDGVTTVSYLFSLEEQNKNLFDVTSSQQTLLDAWDKQRSDEQTKILETLPKDFAKVASDSFHIISFSPDETKVLYRAKKTTVLPPIITPPLIATNQTKEERSVKKDVVYLYDKKEDKNFQIGNWKLEIGNLPQWYPDSKHLVYIDGKKITVVDYDNNNKQTIYSGPFDSSFMTVTTDGNLAILVNLNPDSNQFPDLYLVGTK